MKNIFNKIFSDKYVNNAAISDNIVLLIMYRFAFPFSILLSKLRLTPNQITTLSLLFSLFSFVALVLDDGWNWFVLFWSISLLLDFCDGTVARMTNNIGKTAFRYDHNSDLMKIGLIILGAGFRYDNEIVWGVSFSALFLFMYYTILNHELAIQRKKKIQQPSEQDYNITVPYVRIRERFRIAAWIVKYKIIVNTIKNTYSAIFTINGHTLLIFLLIPFGMEYVLWSFIYFILISLFGCKSRIQALMAIPK